MGASASQTVADRAARRGRADGVGRAPGHFAPAPVNGGRVLRRKAFCACGGGCPRCRQVHATRPKLEVSTPGDAHEQEADRAAEKVLSMAEPLSAAGTFVDAGRSAPPGGGETARLKSIAGATPRIAREAHPGGDAPGGGEPLPESVRNFFEPRFGYDFGHVRVHAGERAAASARSLNALAYTVGRDIVFGEGQYSNSAAGRKLLAHELAHVIQQASGGVRPGTIQRQGGGHAGDADAPRAGGLRATLGEPVQAVDTAEGVDFVWHSGPPGAGLRVLAPTAIDRRHFAYEIVYRPRDVLHTRPVLRVVKTADITVFVFGTLAPGLPGGRLPFDYEVYEVPDPSQVPTQGSPVAPAGTRVNPGSLPVGSPTQFLTVVGLGALGAGALVSGILIGTGLGVAWSTAAVGSEISIAESATMWLLRVAHGAGPRASNIMLAAVQNPVTVLGITEVGAGSALTLFETGSVGAAVLTLGLGTAQHVIQDPTAWRAAGRVIAQTAGRLRIRITETPVRIRMPAPEQIPPPPATAPAGGVNQTASPPAAERRPASPDRQVGVRALLTIAALGTAEPVAPAQPRPAAVTAPSTSGVSPGAAPRTPPSGGARRPSQAAQAPQRPPEAVTERGTPRPPSQRQSAESPARPSAESPAQTVEQAPPHQPGGRGSGRPDDDADARSRRGCPIPVNYREVSASVIEYFGVEGRGTLRFDYQWDSSTGHLSDLAGVTMGEHVQYPGTGPDYDFPNPPWDGARVNPTSLPFSTQATRGMVSDVHLPVRFSNPPYVEQQVVARQHYWFSTPCHNGGARTTLRTFIRRSHIYVDEFEIVRRVRHSGGNRFRYTCTKQGMSARIEPIHRGSVL